MVDRQECGSGLDTRGHRTQALLLTGPGGWCNKIGWWWLQLQGQRQENTHLANLYSDPLWFGRLSILGNLCEEDSFSLRVSMLWVGCNSGHTCFGETVDSPYHLLPKSYLLYSFESQTIAIPTSLLASIDLVVQHWPMDMSFIW